ARGATPVTVYYPVGLEVLAEGNTQALQRGLMELECPPGLTARLVGSMQPIEIESDDPVEFMRLNTLPYNVTDLLVSKYLRLRGRPRFERRALVQLTDQALSSCYMRPRSEPWEVPAVFEIRDLGRVFI